MAFAPGGFLGTRKFFPHIGPIFDDGFEAASPVVMPPHLAVGAGCVVIRCVGIAAIVPFSSHLREQGPKGVAYASLSTIAACTARAKAHPFCWCLPSVRPPLGTTVADPVAHFVTSASDLVGVQTFYGIQLCIPEMHDWMWAVNQHRMLLPRL